MHAPPPRVIRILFNRRAYLYIHYHRIYYAQQPRGRANVKLLFNNIRVRFKKNNAIAIIKTIIVYGVFIGAKNNTAPRAMF